MEYTSITLCHICNKKYAGKSHLYRHLREVHNDYDRILSFREKDEYMFKCLEGCDISFRFNHELRYHLSFNHNFDIKEEYKEFESTKDFQKWFLEMEESGAHFIKPRGSVNKCKRDGSKITYFICNRSGKIKTKTDERKRKLKQQGSRKMNAGCTSFIRLQETDGNNCTATYCDFHYGHKIELEHLPLPLRCRADIAQKLENGAQLVKINLETENILLDNVPRSNILTKLDLKHIKSFTKQKAKLKRLSHITRSTTAIDNSPLMNNKSLQIVSTEKNLCLKEPLNYHTEETANQASSEDDAAENFNKGEYEIIKIQYISENVDNLKSSRNINTETNEIVVEADELSDTDEEIFGDYVSQMLKQIAPSKRQLAKNRVDLILKEFVEN